MSGSVAWGVVVLTAVAGLLVPFQALVNMRLAQVVGGPVRAALISFAIGTLTLVLVVALVARRGAWLTLPPPGSHGVTGNAAALPLWLWLGGVIGAVFVTVTAYAQPRIGSTALAAIFVTAQLLGAMAIDQFGILQAPLPVSPARLAGVVLLLAGAALVITQR